jgi:hypothetical protein
LPIWLDWLERLEKLNAVHADDPEADLQLAKDELRLSTELIEHATGLFSTNKPASLVLYASGCEIGEAVEVRTVSDLVNACGAQRQSRNWLSSIRTTSKTSVPSNAIHRSTQSSENRMKYWEIIADNLSKAGWSWGCVSAIDSGGRTFFVADAHRGDEKVQMAVRVGRGPKPYYAYRRHLRDFMIRS